MITEEAGRNEGVVVKILRIVIEEAKKKESKAKTNFRRDRRNAEKILPAGWMRKRFAEILRAEAEEEWKDRKKKNGKKKEHLEKKNKPRKEEGMYKGIPIGDEELGEDNVEIHALV